MMVQLVKKEAIRKAQPSKKGGLEPGEAEALVEEMKYIMEHGRIRSTEHAVRNALIAEVYGML